MEKMFVPNQLFHANRMHRRVVDAIRGVQLKLRVAVTIPRGFDIWREGEGVARNMELVPTSPHLSRASCLHPRPPPTWISTNK
jgi:hypothetical protein